MKRAVAKFMPGKSTKPRAESPSTFKIDHNSVEDFYISLDNPHKSWLPGEEISGQIVLISRKNLANIAIVFSLCGYVKIHASPHSKLRPVKHTLFSHTIKIYGPDADHPQAENANEFVNGLYKGEHRFPFIVKLPNKRVFTSIDFGKGAIVYVLKTHLRSATDSSGDTSSPGSTASPGSTDIFSMTKSLSKLSTPSFTSEKFVNLINPIDVSELPPQKPKRLIIKDPRRKGKPSRVSSSNATLNTFSTLSSNDSDSISTALTSPNPITPNSMNTHGPNGSSPKTIEPHQQKNIRVSMEISQRGFLRGELIPIKLSIKHLRKIQDSKGIIVTLVRVCRLDYGPDGFYESFRKDLQQSVIPLFVDPNTFSSEINTSLRVPPDAFPTISGCPIVSFQYFIEVMLNLSGKSLSLEGPSEHPKSSVVPLEEPSMSPGNSGSYSFHPYAIAQNRSDFINTDKFKRSKKFLQITSEVIIGTHRSDKAMSATSPDASASIVNSRRSSDSTNSPGQFQTSSQPRSPSQLPPIPESFQVDNFAVPSYIETTNPAIEAHNGTSETQSAPMYEDVPAVPMPQTQENLSEKERVRQHEASLMPSEPQFGDSEGESETVSPLDPDSHILDSLVDEPSFGHMSQSYSSPLGQETSLSLRPNESAHDLYQAPLSSAPDLHEGIGSEGAKDYVPNYDNAANDQLISSTAPEGSRSQEN
ncbi:hypothetical protein CLUG_03445 [Clavispora lusitaniae ATCC 42720]|uniref:pH-response regulator protein palF/RIM8 n=1 Tax=Clavispora lusitaniae (strain ATCC 42720) TaxID=306902 RepID=C4Y5L1_CLAL4|nr:uncharacterized protein CLUG_03445 [Clavispora lusitaniae ATCC 42720]EEQ39317.1 hypothetical protein CLUG_03445 [Clavispora lusitaniae ATCC 42720]